MADEEHLKILRQGVAAWNDWRKKNREVSRPDLREANLREADLRRVDLKGALLRGADLRGALLGRADLRGANLQGGADLSEAHLRGANLSEAHLRGTFLDRADLRRVDLHGADLDFVELHGANLGGANLHGARLIKADLEKANLRGADLRGAALVQADLIQTDLCDATLTGSRVYGASVWDIKVNEGTKQQNLVITDYGEPDITVDNIKTAQFIYLLLNNREIRDVIDTITSKAVLILGRFTEERKVVLDALREELRKHDYLPILFDFEKPARRDLTETVGTLAHLARFVIADITDAKSIPQELQRIVPALPSLPIQPIILESQYEYAMFKDFAAFLSVLPPYRYAGIEQLLASLSERVIAPAIRRAEDIAERRREFERQLG